MRDTISRFVAAMRGTADQGALLTPLQALGDRMSSQLLSTGALAIKAGASPLVKAGSALLAVAKGTLVTKAANTDMAALVGTVTNLKFNVYCFYIDNAGTLTSQMGVEGATLALVQMPVVLPGKAQIGFITINPTGTGNFVGGTTALDDATVVPTAVYVNTLGAFDQSILP